jgi:hypothetical protein
MHQAVDQSTTSDRTTSDASTYREIDEIQNVSGGAPTRFGQRCGIHISIEANRQVEGSRHRAGEIVTLPR